MTATPEMKIGRFPDLLFILLSRCGFAAYSPKCDLHSNRTGSPNFALFYSAAYFSSIEVTVVSDVNFPLTNLLLYDIIKWTYGSLFAGDP